VLYLALETFKNMTKIQEISLDDLWESASIGDRPFHPESLINLPNLARRYLECAIAPGTPLASAVRFWMHGEIKLDQKWHPFKAEEVICWNRGMIVKKPGFFSLIESCARSEYSDRCFLVLLLLLVHVKMEVCRVFSPDP